MNIEDIYVGITLVRANLYWRRYTKGRLYPILQKILQGALFVAVLILVMIGPLYLFSSANPIAQSNRIRRVEVRTRLTTNSSGSFPLSDVSRYSLLDQSYEGLSSKPFKLFACILATREGNAAEIYQNCGYSFLLHGLSSRSADFQRVRIDKTADETWHASGEARSRLRDALMVGSALTSTTTKIQNTTSTVSLGSFAVPAASDYSNLICDTLPPLPDAINPVQLEVEVTFRREISLSGIGSDVIALTCARALLPNERFALAASLDSIRSPQATTTTTAEAGAPTAPPPPPPPPPASVDIDGAFPKFLRLPSVRNAKAEAMPPVGSSNGWHTLQNLTLTLHSSSGGDGGGGGGGNTREWWEIRQRSDDYTQFGATTDDGLSMIVAAERLVGGEAASSFTGQGIFAFYIVVVYGIGRMVRAACGGQRYVYTRNSLSLITHA